MASNNNQQLKKLLKKNENKSGLGGGVSDRGQKESERKIQHEKYKIKQGQSAKKSKNVKSLTAERHELENMGRMKKDLQQKLNFVDSRIGQLTQPDKSSRVLDEDQRRKFVTQMVKARKQLEKKRQQKIRLENQKQKERHQKEQQMEKKKGIDEKERKKQEILKRQESKQLKKKQQSRELENQNKLLKEKLKQKILSDKMNDQFRQHEAATTLQQRKKRLAQIRSLHKPITKNQFNEHLQKIEQMKSKVGKSESKINTSRYLGTNDQKKFYKSVWYKKEQEKKIQFQNQKHQEELYQIKQNKDKLAKYSEYVRHNFRPQVSKKKSQELQQKSKSMTMNGKKEDGRELGLRYLEFSKQQADPSKQRQNSQPEIKKAFRYFNYLQDLKKNHQNKSSQNFVESIKKKKDLSTSEKAQKILTYAQTIEQKVKMRQQMNKANQNLIDEDLDQLYMEAIEAKLSVLGKK